MTGLQTAINDVAGTFAGIFAAELKANEVSLVERATAASIKVEDVIAQNIKSALPTVGLMNQIASKEASAAIDKLAAAMVAKTGGAEQALADLLIMEAEQFAARLMPPPAPLPVPAPPAAG